MAAQGAIYPIVANGGHNRYFGNTNTSISNQQINQNTWSILNQDENWITKNHVFSRLGDAITNISFIFNCSRENFPVSEISIWIGGQEIVTYYKSVILNSDAVSTHSYSNDKFFVNIHFPIELVSLQWHPVELKVKIAANNSNFETFLNYAFYDTEPRRNLASNQYHRLFNKYYQVQNTFKFTNGQSTNKLEGGGLLSKMWIEIPEAYRDNIDLKLKLNRHDYNTINNLTSWQTYVMSNKTFDPKVWLFIPTLSNQVFMPHDTRFPFIHRSNNPMENQGLNIGRIDHLNFDFVWKDNPNQPCPTEDIPITIVYETKEILQYVDGMAGLVFMVAQPSWNPVIIERPIDPNFVQPLLPGRPRPYNPGIPANQELPIEDIGTIEPPRSRFCCISMEELNRGDKYDLCGGCNNIMLSSLAEEWYRQNSINHSEVKCPMWRAVIITRKVGIIP